MSIGRDSECRTMMLQIEDFLQAEAVAMLLDLVEQGRFEDGRATAGAELQSVKANEQLRITEREGRVIQKVLLPAMERNQAFLSFAWPRRLHVPRLSRYRVGMEYGAHIDNPIMGGAAPWCTAPRFCIGSPRCRTASVSPW